MAAHALPISPARCPTHPGLCIDGGMLVVGDYHRTGVATAHSHLVMFRRRTVFHVFHPVGFLCAHHAATRHFALAKARLSGKRLCP